MRAANLKPYFSQPQIAQLLGKKENTVALWQIGQRNQGRTQPDWPEELMIPLLQEAFQLELTLDQLVQSMLVFQVYETERYAEDLEPRKQAFWELVGELKSLIEKEET